MELEQAGVPAVHIVTSQFVSVHSAASRSSGIPTRSVVVPHPVAANTTQELDEKAEAALDAIIAGLTAADEDPVASTADARQASVVFTGTLAEVDEHFYNNLWTDGLPIVPPTREAVEDMLRGTDLPAEHLVALIEPLKGRATIEKIAINAVMAGARPEYLPVIIAAVEAVTDPAFGLGDVQASTNPVTPLLIINGPIRGQLDINSGSGCFGPGWKANATIGRALRLIMINLGGGFPKVTDMDTQGQPGKYTMCIGENEEALPPGWEPLHVERGFNRESSTVTVYPTQELKRAGYGGLPPMAEAMLTPGQYPYCFASQEILVIFSPDDMKYVINGISEPPTIVAGQTREGAQKYLFENSAVPYSRIMRGHLMHDFWRGQVKPGEALGCVVRANPDDRVPIVQSPEKFVIIVAGGPGLHSVYCVPNRLSSMVTKEIRLPANWGQLIEQAKAHARKV